MDPAKFDPAEWTMELFEKHQPRHAFSERGETALGTWRGQFRTDLRETLGHDVIANAGVPPLEARQLDAEGMDGYIQEEWDVMTETGLRVPFYLLVPEEGEPPYPVAICAHGHTEYGHDLTIGQVGTDDQPEAITEHEQDFAKQAVREGYAAIAPEIRGFGRLGNHSDQASGEGFCRTMQMHAQLFGRSLVGERTWDITRLIDFAETRDDLDDDRVLLTGHSGGGTVTVFAAAIDERIDVAVPSAYFCVLRESIASINHCECNYAQGVLELGEIWDVAGLIAPRPFLATTGRDDPIFPLFGVEEAFERLQPVYEAAGAPEHCRLFVGDGGHRYFKDAVWPFVAEHL